MVELLFMWQSNWNVSSSMQGQMNQLKVCGWELRDRLMRDTVVGAHYRPLDQEEGTDEAFYGQLEIASWSHTLILLGHFNHSDICWRGNTAQHTQSRKFLRLLKKNLCYKGWRSQRRIQRRAAVLVSAGKELVFFPVAGTVMCFRFRI